METLKELFYFLTDIEALIRWGGLTALIIIIFAETGLLVGFFLPGDSLLVTAGLFAARGHFDIFVLNITLILAAIIGDAVGYSIGKKSGQKLYHKEDSRFFKKEHLLKTKEFYEKYGGITIVLARFMPFARTFAPVVAGVAEMTYKKFATYNIFGGIFWVMSTTLTGYFLGSFIPDIDKHLFKVIAIVVFLSLLPGIIKFLQIKFQKRKSQVAE
ncbi:MAG: VTT domain-containing protein [Ignavibacteriales bacterium]|nr:VTT domain-containing protein [Ignavibacteriales bacterium]